MVASGAQSLVFINDMTVDRRSRMNCEVYRPQIQPNAAKLIRWQLNNDPKHAKSFSRQRNKTFFSHSVSHLITTQQSISVTEGKTAATGTHKQRLKVAAVKAWQSNSREEMQHLVILDFRQSLTAESIPDSLKIALFLK